MATIEYLPITNMTAKVRNRLPSVEPLTYQYHAYQWALELAEHCTKPMEDKTLKDLDKMVFRYDNHLGLFKGPGSDAILRIYWPEKDRVVYYRVINYEQLSEEQPDMVNLLLRNGEYAYLKDTDARKLWLVYHTH